MNEVQRADRKLRLAAERAGFPGLKFDGFNLPAPAGKVGKPIPILWGHEVWGSKRALAAASVAVVAARIQAAMKEFAARADRYVLPPGPTTIVFGLGVHRVARERGLPSSEIRLFRGGYDDWAGSMWWAEVPGTVDGPQARFCPEPGRWETGVRV